MRSEIQAFEIQQNYSKKLFCQHLLRRKKKKEEEGNVKREEEGRQWEGSGYNQDELHAESGSVDRGLLLSRCRHRLGRMRQADVKIWLFLQNNRRVKVMQENVTWCLKTRDGNHGKGNILREVSLDND